MLARQSPAEYLAAALTTAAIRGAASPLAALAAPAWARRRMRSYAYAALPRVDIPGPPKLEGVGVGVAPRRQLQQLPPPPEAIVAWQEEWSAWRLELRRALRTQLLPLLGQVASLAPPSD